MDKNWYVIENFIEP